nr:hypothetical protein [Tanacetum cinerariifolium]
NPIGNGNLVAVRDEGNAPGHLGNQIRCYNCRGVGHFARDCAVRPRRRDVTPPNWPAAEYWNVGNQVAQNPRVQNVGNQNGLIGVHENGNQNPIGNEEQYTELLEPIPEPQQVPQNDNNVISEVTDMEQGGETVEQHSANFEETRALYEPLYQNLAVQIEKVNSVNRKLKETNADLTTELA